jgi:hypothetical protein
MVGRPPIRMFSTKEGDIMKSERILTVILTCLAISSLYVITACSEPESHIANINLKNDLGSQATLDLCKDELHCESISNEWVQKKIDNNDTESIVVSNEKAIVFKVSSESNGKPNVRCLRIRLDKSIKTSRELLLSSATDC